MPGLVLPDDELSDDARLGVGDALNDGFGLNETGGPTEETLARARALIAAHDAQNGDQALPAGISDAEALANSQKLGPSAHAAPTPAEGMPRMTRIILEEVENMPPTGQPFSLNGKAYIIRPGEPVDIPEGLLEVIDNAVISKPITDPQTLKVIGHRNAHRFPYRVIRNAA